MSLRNAAGEIGTEGETGTLAAEALQMSAGGGAEGGATRRAGEIWTLEILAAAMTGAMVAETILQADLRQVWHACMIRKTAHAVHASAAARCSLCQMLPAVAFARCMHC